MVAVVAGRVKKKTLLKTETWDADFKSVRNGCHIPEKLRKYSLHLRIVTSTPDTPSGAA
jgi:hypothetical protein